MEKPLYVKEIESHTGLVCVKAASGNEWWVLSPTGIGLCKVSSSDGQVIGSVSVPDMFRLQGISSEERSARRYLNCD